MAEIGEILSELREDKGLTQNQLAEIFHISGSSISAYELGIRPPSIEVLLSYTKFFNVSADYILGLTHYPTTLSSFTEEYSSGKTIEDLIHDAKALSDVQKEALLLVIKGMAFYTEVTSRTNSQNEKKKWFQL